jgi:hypothetical protein
MKRTNASAATLFFTVLGIVMVKRDWRADDMLARRSRV